MILPHIHPFNLRVIKGDKGDPENPGNDGRDGRYGPMGGQGEKKGDPGEFSNG